MEDPPTTCCRTAELDQHLTGSVYLNSESLKRDIFDYCGNGELICCRLKSEKQFCLFTLVVCDFCNKKSKSV